MKAWILGLVLGCVSGGTAQEYITAPKAGPIEPPTRAWIATIHALAPDQAVAVPMKPRKVLVFSLATGFKHTVAPHVKEIVRMLGDKSGAFEVEFCDDIRVFEEERLEAYDAVLLNNVCPKGPTRDLFLDVLGNAEQTARFEGNLLEYVSQGGGLAVIHGAIAFQINTPAVSEMMGGSFDWHPKSQRVTLELVDPAHPLVAGFGGKGYIHQDEPYLFKNAYKEKNFHPLLMMDVSKLDEETRQKKGVGGDVRYVAWIKPHGEGRVFYCGPSHYPASYETEAMLRFLLGGIQYVLGDLDCDDSPVGVK
jgi:type 1 glutamine amidotransferase